MRLCLLIITLLTGFKALPPTDRQIIIDADTANEVDDPYAIARAFAEPGWNITTLNAAQWQASQWATQNTMEDSHRLNSTLHAYLNLGEKVLLRRGGSHRMYDWGDKAQHSAAAYEIIKQAHKQKNGDKLVVIALGALTNVASALFIDPEIAPKLEVYWLGTTYDFENNISKRVDFNPAMDIQAVEIMLTSQVEMHIMPINVVFDMKADFSRAKKELQGKHDLTDFLINRWYNHVDGGRDERILWDVALIEAIAHPDWVEQVKVPNFENKNVWMYKQIDEQKFMDDMYASIVRLASELK